MLTSSHDMCKTPAGIAAEPDYRRFTTQNTLIPIKIGLRTIPTSLRSLISRAPSFPANTHKETKIFFQLNPHSSVHNLSVVSGVFLYVILDWVFIRIIICVCILMYCTSILSMCVHILKQRQKLSYTNGLSTYIVPL